jgi:type I restriction-modification system DNA methylase subunit
MKNFKKSLDNLTASLRVDFSTAFTHYLEYAIKIHSFTYKKDTSMFTKEQMTLFFEVHKSWIFLLDKEVKDDSSWFDAFGECFEEFGSKWTRDNKGQFFTPVSLCNMMVAMTIDKESKKQHIPDPSCGSGRLLLASHAFNPKNYHYGVDLDRTCCLMTALNMMMHGCQGEVLYGNSLTNEYYEAWRINGNMKATMGVPHIDSLILEDSIYYKNMMLKELKQDEILGNPINRQTSLFDNDFF